MASDTSGSVGFYEFLAWAEKNKRQLVIGFVAAIVVAGALATYFWWRNVVELKANEALLKLQPSAADQTATPAEAPASDYLKIVQEYPNTDAASRALLLAAGALFKEGKYADAATRFEEFLNKSGSHSMAPIASYGWAASLESQGKQTEAVTGYQNVTNRFPKSAVVDDAKLALARIYEGKNQPELALRIYNEPTVPTPTGAGNPQAQIRKQLLLTAHPELAVTNAPPTVSTNVPIAPSTNLPAPATTNTTTSTNTNAAPAPATPPPVAPAQNATPQNTTPAPGAAPGTAPPEAKP